MNRAVKTFLLGGLAACVLSLSAFGATLTVGGKAYAVVKDCPDTGYNASLTVLPAAAGEKLTSFDILFAAGEDGTAYYRVLNEGRKLTLTRTVGGKTVTLATSAVRHEGETRSVRIRRRLRMLSVYVEGADPLSVFDAALAAGSVCIAPHKQSITVRDWHYQPVEPISWTDGFTRGPTEKGEWENLRGMWRLRTVVESKLKHAERKNREVQPERSANFFYFTGELAENGTDALCAAGHDFWDDYRFAVSLNSGGGPIGLVFYLQDADNYYLVRWYLNAQRVVPQPLELVRVTKGQEQVLARASVPGSAEQWYRLAVMAEGTRIRVKVDETSVIDVQHSGWTHGRIGLYQMGAEKPLYDDAECTSLRVYNFDTAETLALGRVQRPKGFRVVSKPMTGTVGNIVPAVLETNGGGRMPFGDETWARYLLTTTAVRQDDQGVIGLAMTSSVDDTALLLECGRVAGAAAPVTRLLLKKAGGQPVVIASCEGLAATAGEHEISLDTRTTGKVAAYVDGDLVLRADNPLSGGMRPGLLAENAKATFRSTRVHFTEKHDSAAKVNVALFATDKYMAGWANDRMAWVKDDGHVDRHWNKGDFHGRFELAVPLLDTFNVYLAAREHDISACYTLAGSKPAAEAPAKLTLKRGDTVVAEAEVTEAEAANPCLVVRDGHYIVASIGERELFSYRDAKPLAGTQIGVTAAEAVIEKLDVRQYNVKDYLFQRAPSEWVKLGMWEVTNRFACDPRWSWFSGTQWEGLAAIWNKAKFHGDVTVEFYAGMRMQTSRGMNYPRVGDINVTLGCDPDDLSTGYSAVFAGWDPEWTGRWSFLTRGTARVAASDRELIPLNRFKNPRSRVIPVPWDPGGRPIHGAWYYIKVRKVGDVVKCYFDNVPVMEYRDPMPLKGDRVAIWTQSDSIMVARVRISYEDMEAQQLEVKPLPIDGDAARMAVSDGPAVTKTVPVASTTHPGAVCDFEGSLDGWQTANGDQGARLMLDTVAPGAGESSLCLINDYPGGTFGARLPMPRLLPFLVSEFSFRYRITPEVKVNLYMTLAGHEYYIHFTGPDEEMNGLTRLASVSNVRADGQWHTARIPLSGAVIDLVARRAANAARIAGVEAAKIDPASLRCEELLIGQYHGGYLRAGFDGNPAGARFWIDDVTVVSAGGPAVVFKWETQTPETTLLTSFSFKEPADPTGEPQAGVVEGLFTADKAGRWYFNIQQAGADGGALAVRHVPFDVDMGPVQAAALAPAKGAKWGGNPLKVTLANVAAGNVDTRGARLSVNGEDWPLPPGAVRFAPGSRELTVNLQNPAGTRTLANGVAVALKLWVPKYATSALGASGGSEGVWIDWATTYAHTLDKTAPTRPRLTDFPLSDDFESGIQCVKSVDGQTSAALVGADREGDHALKVWATTIRSPMALTLLQKPYDASRYPLLSFDYNLPPAARVDMAVSTGAGEYVLRMTDDHSENVLLGHVPNLVADGTWRHAELNLRLMLREHAAKTNVFTINQITISDRGYRAAAPGTCFYLDNVGVVSVTSAAAGLKMKWGATDPSGIRGYALSWSSDPAEVPHEEITTTESEGVIQAVPEGDVYLHIRAQDNAGNWGPTSHYRFLIDNSPPRIVGKQGGDVLGEAITLTVEDSGPAGIDYSNFTVKIGDKALKHRPGLSTWDPKKGTLAWDWPLSSTEHVPPRPDGSHIDLIVSGLKDHAGNAANDVTLKMRIDYAADKTPPTIPNVASETGELLLLETFSEGEGEWKAHQPDPYTDMSRVRRDGGRDYCLQIANKNRVSYGAYARRQPYDLQKYPFLSFDYRMQPGIQSHIIANIDGQVYSVALTVHRTGYREAGRVDDFKADNRWHHTRIDLKKHIAANHPAGAKYQVRWLFIGNMLNQSAPKTFWIDNFAIFGPAETVPKLTWASQDATGIAGYSLVLDANAETMPDKEIDVKGPTAPLKGIPTGAGYLHVRAQDGAGNWGGAAHVPLQIAMRVPATIRLPQTVTCAACGAVSPRQDLVTDPADKAAAPKCPKCGKPVTLKH